MRKFLSLLLSLIMLISLTACSATGITDSQQTSQGIQASGEIHTPSISKTPNAESAHPNTTQSGEVYVKERIELPDAQSYIYWSALTGDKIFSYGIDSYNNQVFYLINPADCTVEMPSIQIDNIYLIGQSYDNTQPILAINEDGEYVLSVFEDAELLNQTVLKLPEQYAEDIVTGITLIPDYYIVELSREIIALKRNCEFEKSLGNFNGAALCSVTKSGQLVVAGCLAPDNPAAKSVTKVTVLGLNLELLETYESEIQFDAFCAGNVDGEILALKDGIVYSYLYKSGEIIGTIDAISSGMNSAQIFYSSDNNYISFQNGVPVIWSVLNDEGIKVLTMATYNLSYSLELLIDMFNESSSDCKIKVVDYAAYNNSDSNNNNGLIRLNADIVAGFTPDLYDLTNLNAQSFIQNNLLENMGNYFSQFGVDPQGVVSSVYESMLIGNEIYYIMPSFNLLSVIGNRDTLGNNSHLTSDTFFSMASELPTEMLFGSEMTREAFLRYALLFNLKEYINADTKTCSFTPAGFGRFLEFASHLPAEIDYSQIDSQDIARAYAGEQKLILSSISGDLISFFSYYDTAFSGKAEYVGFPSDFSSGTAFVPTALVGISSTSPYAEKSMEFIAFILSEYCQSSGAIAGLPINKNALEKRIDYWASEYDKFKKSLVTVYDGIRIELGGVVSADYAKEHIYAAIDKGDTLAIFDDALFQLIYNESQSYFVGKTTISQCLDVLNSKVQLYLAEKF